MPVIATVELPVATKDPREVIAECIRIIRSKTVFPGSMEIHLGLMCGANLAVLSSLAEKLPLMALGFRTRPSNRAITAGEFRANPGTNHCTFRGDLTDYFDPATAISLIEELLASPPQAIRSTAFNVSVRKIQWKGSSQDCSGWLGLFDLKAFKRAARFSLSLNLEIPGADPGAPEVMEMIKNVAQISGIAFDNGHLSRAPGEKGHSPEHGQAALIGKICFDEVVESAADQLPGHLVSEFAPIALSPADASVQRFQQWGNRPPSKVNLPSIIKSAMKELLPELKFGSTDADEILFFKSLGPSADLIAVFLKEMHGIGKAFTLSLGVRCLEENIRFTTNVFQFERTTERKTWIYGDIDEAKAVAREAVNLTKMLLPRFESRVQSCFRICPKELPAEIELHGPLSARQAFEKAQRLAVSQYSDAVLIRVLDRIRSLKTRDIEGPELSMDGRLKMNGAWWFHFYSPKRDVSFEVTVPFVGRIRVRDHGKQYQNPNARYILAPVGEDWMDSDRAFALAEERGGRERRESGRHFGISTKLQTHPSYGPYWGIMYLVFDERGRKDLIVNIDALTGEPLNQIRGF